MNELQAVCSMPNPTAHELYRVISSDITISAEVMRISRSITKNRDTLAKAIIILGVNTIKNVALMISDTISRNQPKEIPDTGQRRSAGSGSDDSSEQNHGRLRKDGMPLKTGNTNDVRIKELVGHLMDLNVKERLILALRHQEKLSLEEITAIMGIPKESVSQLHSRALQTLQGKMQACGQTNHPTH